MNINVNNNTNNNTNKLNIMKSLKLNIYDK